MEMNTRLQVEHPVTEMVTGWDLVEWQVRIAAGRTLPATQDDIEMRGTPSRPAVYAEDPAAGSCPPAGPCSTGGAGRLPGVRVDSGLRCGMTVGATTTRCWPRSSPTPTTGPRRCAA